MNTVISPTTIGLGLAAIAVIQVLAVIVLQGIIAARTERRTARIKQEEKDADATLKKQEREEDYARQDLVAARVAVAAQQAADAAQLLVQAQHDTIARTDEVARLAAEAASHINTQLKAIDDQGKKIHILVNSDMTAARTNERDQTKLTLLALIRVQALSANLGIPEDKAAVEAIAAAEARIAELNSILADRLAAQKRVDAEASSAQAKADDDRVVLLSQIAKNTSATAENTKK
jgi:hypothetical protein